MHLTGPNCNGGFLESKVENISCSEPLKYRHLFSVQARTRTLSVICSSCGSFVVPGLPTASEALLMSPYEAGGHMDMFEYHCPGPTSLSPNS